MVLFVSLCDHDNLTIKFYQKIATLIKGGFYRRFKVGSVPGMINKGVLAQFTYKPT